MIGHTLLKRYKVLRPLDEGGMSHVYLGIQTEPAREVAIKVLKGELAVQNKVREHFRREIYILSKFHHPHSVAYFDADADAKQPLLVMEYLRGLDLGKLLERHRRLSVERTGRLLGQMCAVLQAAHSDGIVHRDIKPGNFMVVHPDTPQEQIKLMDYGLAKMSSMLYIAPEEMVNLRSPTASGTPEYIAPEQIKGNDVDRRSDLYSLGVILYEMLTGRRPFTDTNVNRLLLAHCDDRPPAFAAVGASGIAPAGIEQLVMDCLAKYPEARPQSAEELATRFEEVLGKKIYDRSQSPSPGSLSKPSVVIRKMQNAPVLAAEKNAVVKRLTATMPESMAMLKLKGFIHDLGGEIVESVPGRIKVRLSEVQPQKPSGGFLGWFKGTTAVAVQATTINMELQMEKPDLSQPSRLAITLKLTSPTGSFSAEGRTRCDRISRDLQAYLMGG
jgi:eukaryotic-like serine/threonine-protein kinase